MRKFSKKFSVICDITVSSQIVYVGNGPVGAIFRAEKNVHIVNEEKVVSLINALEPRLGKLSKHNSRISNFQSISKYEVMC